MKKDNSQDRLMDIIGGVDDKYIKEAEPVNKLDDKTTKFKSNSLAKWIGFVAGVILITGVSVAIWQMGVFDDTSNQNTTNTTMEDSRWPKKTVYVEGENEAGGEEIAIIKKWYEMGISEQFSEFDLNNNKYSTNVCEIAHEHIGNIIDEVTLAGYDIYEDKTYTANAVAYEIKDISSQCAVAIQFEGRTDYYVYKNSWYRPKTLGEFIDILNLGETISFGKVYYSYFDKNNDNHRIEFEDIDDKVVWDILLTDKTLQNQHEDKHWHISLMGISVDIPLLGYENISLAVTEDGYLTTNILDTGKCFYLGEDKVQEFVDYVIDNCEGYEIVYVYDKDEKPMPEIGNLEEEPTIEEYTTRAYKGEK